jgi:hypothetical protein
MFSVATAIAPVAALKNARSVPETSTFTVIVPAPIMIPFDGGFTLMLRSLFYVSAKRRC